NQQIKYLVLSIFHLGPWRPTPFLGPYPAGVSWPSPALFCAWAEAPWRWPFDCLSEVGYNSRDETHAELSPASGSLARHHLARRRLGVRRRTRWVGGARSINSNSTRPLSGCPCGTGDLGDEYGRSGAGSGRVGFICAGRPEPGVVQSRRHHPRLG